MAESQLKDAFFLIQHSVDSVQKCNAFTNWDDIFCCWPNYLGTTLSRIDGNEIIQIGKASSICSLNKNLQNIDTKNSN